MRASNLLLDTLCSTSPLMPRCVRLSLLYFGLLLELATSALFFNLQNFDTLDFSFWESTFDNIWISFYSSLLSAFLLLLPAFALRLPSSILSALRQSKNPSNLLEVYHLKRKRILCSRCCGLLVFALLSGFLSLYLFAFGLVVSDQAAWAWLSASLLAMAIDLVLLEVARAIFFGAVVTVALQGECMCCVCFLVLFSLYRTAQVLTL